MDQNTDQGKMVGGNMEKLNMRLIKHIKMVRALEEKEDCNASMMNTSINVKIDRSKLILVGKRNEEDLVVCRAECKAVNEEIVDLLAKVTQLEADISHCNKRNLNKKGAILSGDLKIEKLKAEINRLKFDLTLAERKEHIFETKLKGLRLGICKTSEDLDSGLAAYTEDKRNSDMLEGRLQILGKDLRFKISVLGWELVMEDKSTKKDISNIEDKIKDIYQIKIDTQIQLLRNVYEEQIKAYTVSQDSLYQSKITDLQNEIGQLPNSIEQDGECQVLDVKLASCYLEQGLLDRNTLELVNKKNSVEAAVDEMDRFFQSQLAAKGRDLKLLEDENEEIKKQIWKLMKKSDLTEARSYSNTLASEIGRTSSRFSIPVNVNTSKTLKYPDLDEEALGVKVEDDEVAEVDDAMTKDVEIEATKFVIMGTQPILTQVCGINFVPRAGTLHTNTEGSASTPSNSVCETGNNNIVCNTGSEKVWVPYNDVGNNEPQKGGSPSGNAGNKVIHVTFRPENLTKIHGMKKPQEKVLLEETTQMKCRKGEKENLRDIVDGTDLQADEVNCPKVCDRERKYSGDSGISDVTTSADTGESELSEDEDCGGMHGVNTNPGLSMNTVKVDIPENTAETDISFQETEKVARRDTVAVDTQEITAETDLSFQKTEKVVSRDNKLNNIFNSSVKGGVFDTLFKPEVEELGMMETQETDTDPQMFIRTVNLEDRKSGELAKKTTSRYLVLRKMMRSQVNFRYKRTGSCHSRKDLDKIFGDIMAIVRGGVIFVGENIRLK